MNRIARFLNSEDGPTAVEYAVLLAGILVAVLAGITLVGGQTANYWSNNQSQLNAVYSKGAGS